MRVKIKVVVVSGQGEGSLILLLEHTITQRTNTVRGYRGLTENKKGWNGSLLTRAHTVVVETPRE